MRRVRATTAPTYFEDAAAFRRWLAAHAATEDGLLVGFHKVGSGTPSMTWSESVDEALCFGWIDAVRKRVDGERYTIRFTKRKRASNWSAINIAKFELLRKQGRTTPGGEAAFAHRTEDRSRIYAYEQAETAKLAPEEERAFRRNAKAWKYLEGVPPSYRKVVMHWITTAKKPETRAKRLASLIAACAAGKRL